MLNIKVFTVNMVQENCYILSDETKDAVIIDDGAYFPEEEMAIEQYILSEGLTPKHLILTHAHFDHIMGSGKVFEKYCLKAEMSNKDAYLYDMASLQAQSIIGRKLDFQTAPVGNFLKDSDKVEFGSHSLSVIETPGHTLGGVCFYCEAEKILFSGDSLFQQSIGRTDLKGGNMEMLIKSLKEKVLTLPEETKVYPGHGSSTQIGYEKENNIYFKYI